MSGIYIYVYVRIYRAHCREDAHADTLHLAMRVRRRGRAIFFFFFYQKRENPAFAREAISRYSRRPFFFAAQWRNRINQRDGEPGGIVKVRLDRDGRAH